MFKKALFIIVLFILCHQVYNYDYLMTDEDPYLLYMHFEEKFLFWSGSIVLMVVVNYTVNFIDVPIAPGVILVCFGVIWGIASLFSYWMYCITKSTQVDKVVNALPDAYMPLLVFSTAFFVDINIFYKGLVQILIISIPITILSGVLTGIMMELVSDFSWNLLEALVFGSITSCIYPMEVLKWFNNSNVKSKYLGTLLHGECVLATCVIVNMQQLLRGHLNGWAVHWYQYICNSVRVVIMGLPLGYLFGCFGTCMIKFIYNKSSLLMPFTISSAYISFYFGSWIGSAGLVTCMITGLIMARERTSLSNNIQERLDILWKMLNHIFMGIILLTVSIRAPSLLLVEVDFQDYIFIFVVYLVSNVTRFLGFALFSPILSRTGHGMTFKNLIICVWCGIKSPICLLMGVNAFEPIQNSPRQKIIFLHILGVYFLTLLINWSFVPVLMRALGMSDISITSQTNMNNCMKYIYDTRARTIAVLKMDRFLADANWPLVLTTTSLKHPYRKFNLFDDLINEDEDDFLFGNRFTYCSYCQKHIPTELTPKETKEITKAAKLRILKMRKCIYSRLFESGLLNKKGFRFLHQALEQASDSDHFTINIQNLLNMFKKENKILRYFQTRINHIFSEKSKKKSLLPEKCWNHWSYATLKHLAFIILMTTLVLYSISLHFYKMFKALDETSKTVIFISNFILLGAFLFEFVIKILAKSTSFNLRKGLFAYFKSPINIVQFLILCCTFCETMLNCLNPLLDSHLILEVLTTIFLLLRILGLLSYTKTLSCTHSMLKAISIYLDIQVNSHKALALHIAINSSFTETEILQNFKQIVDNEKVRNKIKYKIENDRKELNRRIVQFHKEQPWVTSTLKTKVAVNAVLNSMKDELTELKVSGWVDDVEYNKLVASLEERHRFVNTIKVIEPCSPKLIFEGLGYMGDDQELNQFLYSNLSSRRYDPGGVVLAEGEIVDGIYIFITGSFIATYLPNEFVLQLLKEKGALPVVDYLCGSQFDTPATEYKTAGNSVGELSVLTGRAYDGQIVAETHGEALFLSLNLVKEALRRDTNLVGGLECRMWKGCMFNIALMVLLNVPAYRVFTYDKIIAKLERAFVPVLSSYKIFVVNNMMHDIILVHGIVIDFNTRKVYTAPCYIPRAVQKLIFPRSSLYNISNPVEVKLMILPEKDFDEYEIMAAEEQICTMDEEYKITDLSTSLEHESNSSQSFHIKYVRDIEGGTTKQGDATESITKIDGKET